MRQAVAHFLFQLVFGVAVAFVVAALWALARGGGFLYSLHVGLYVTGGFAIVLGALGVAGGSPSERIVSTSRIPGMPAFLRPPDATGVNATAILILTGAVLIAVAVFV